jgi:hypothetical protein
VKTIDYRAVARARVADRVSALTGRAQYEAEHEDRIQAHAARVQAALAAMGDSEAARRAERKRLKEQARLDRIEAEQRERAERRRLREQRRIEAERRKRAERQAERQAERKASRRERARALEAEMKTPVPRGHLTPTLRIKQKRLWRVKNTRARWLPILTRPGLTEAGYMRRSALVRVCQALGVDVESVQNRSPYFLHVHDRRRVVVAMLGMRLTREEIRLMLGVSAPMSTKHARGVAADTGRLRETVESCGLPTRLSVSGQLSRQDADKRGEIAFALYCTCRSFSIVARLTGIDRTTLMSAARRHARRHGLTLPPPLTRRGRPVATTTPTPEARHAA